MNKIIIPKFVRKFIFLTADILGVLLAWFFANQLLETNSIIEILTQLKWITLGIVVIRIGNLLLFGIYNILHRYFSVFSILKLFTSVFLGSLILVTGKIYFNISSISYSVLILEFIFVTGALSLNRLILRMIREYLNKLRFSNKQSDKTLNIIIIGAGNAGEIILRDLKRSKEYKIIGFFDDDKKKKGQLIHGVKILGPPDKISFYVKKYNIQEAIIAIPSASGSDIRRLTEICMKSGLSSKITPGLFELLSGSKTVSQLREVNIEDLLGRKVIGSKYLFNEKYIQDKTVLVSGAAGSIGSEICRQVLKLKAKRLILLDHSETGIFNIENELKSKHPDAEIFATVTDIKDFNLVENIFEKYAPDVVFHAAAYKHVTLMESNIQSVIANNVQGTFNIIELAETYNVKEFVLISTDKAVNPTNCMGASKRVCELLMQTKKNSITKYSAVRFGNVLGSNGSVVPIFKDQIKNGGPVTVRDENMTRFFMTIPEAVRLVINAGGLGSGGDIFILDMGEPVKIVNLAKDLIKLSGLELNKDIEIIFTGAKKGEKIHEELWFDKSFLKPTSNNKIFIAKPSEYDSKLLRQKINNLVESISKKDEESLKEDLFEIVNTMKPELIANI